MVSVTERAKEKLKELLTNETDDPSVSLRLETTSPGQLGVFADRARTDDQVVEHQGAVVLLVGQETALAVGETMIDCDESEAGSRLVIRRS